MAYCNPYNIPIKLGSIYVPQIQQITVGFSSLLTSAWLVCCQNLAMHRPGQDEQVEPW